MKSSSLCAGASSALLSLLEGRDLFAADRGERYDERKGLIAGLCLSPRALLADVLVDSIAISCLGLVIGLFVEGVSGLASLRAA